MTRCIDVIATRAFMEEGMQLPVAEFLPLACAEVATLVADTVDPRDRISVLEELRPGLWRQLANFEREQLARALPFNDNEAARWRTYIEAWSLLLGAYMRSLADADQGEAGVVGLAPLLLQRVVRQAVQVAIASYRAYQPVEPALWTLIHDHLRRAEKAGIADLPVADPTVAMDARGTVAEACLHLLLVDFCDPYSLSPTQLALASRWLERLARYARLSLEVIPHGPAGVLVVNLDQPHGIRLLAAAPDPAFAYYGSPRFVELAPVREQLKRLLAKVRLGIPPRDLYLGEDCTREEAEALLERMHRRWRTTRRRQYPRRPASEETQLALGLAEVYRFLTQYSVDLDAAEHSDLAGAQDGTSAPLPALVPSQIVDQSPSGLGLVQAPGGSARLRCQQLLALVGAREVLLGSVRWLSIDAEVGLRFGVRVIPGRARPVRLQTSSTEVGAYERGLLLAGMPGLGEPPSLVTSPGVFWTGRELRMWTDAAAELTENIRLDQVLELGSDFERVSFTIVR